MVGVAWLNDLQSHLVGEPGAWLPLLLLFGAYPARLLFRNTDATSALILMSWIVVFLYGLSQLELTFGTASSENPSWFEDNTADYYEFVLFPLAIKQVIFTLPFLCFAKLGLPSMERRLILVLIGFALVDMALLSVLPQRLLQGIA